MPERLEFAGAQSGYGVYEFNIKTKTLRWDRMMYTLMGVPQGTEVSRQSWRQLIHPEDAIAAYNCFEHAVAGGDVSAFEMRIVRASDRSLRYIENSARVRRDADGNPEVIVGLNLDITARKVAEFQRDKIAKIMGLIASKTPLSEILNAIVVGVEKISPSSICSVLLLDPEAKHFLFGAGEKVRGFYDARVAGLSITGELGSCGPAVTFNRRVVTEDITQDPNWNSFVEPMRQAGLIACWSQPITIGNEVVGTFAMYHPNVHSPNEDDIMMIENCSKLAAIAIQHTRNEEALEEQRMKLISSVKMAALGEMAGGIAHEINNPLAIIVGKATQLSERLAENRMDPMAFQRDLLKIVDTGNRIAKIIKGLKAFARDAERDPFEPTSILRVVEDALEISRERFKGREISIECRLPDESLKTSARAAQLSQVVVNLLNNAFDAVSDLPEKWVRIEAETERDQIVLRFTDSGPGIRSDVVEKLMQPFFTTKQVGKGTGLGLSITKGIVEEHGGRFYYDPSSTHTRFVVELPYLKPDVVTDAKPA